MEERTVKKYLSFSLPPSQSPAPLSLLKTQFTSGHCLDKIYSNCLKQTTEDTLDERTTAIGSEGNCYFENDLGFFDAVFTAWKNHWKLRTRPDDWWLSFSTKVAKGIDTAAKDPALARSMRDFFVSFEGKKTIEVVSPAYTIYEVDYTAIFDQFSKGIRSQIKHSGYTKLMECDFSTTTSTQRISSQIALMTSLREFFDYRMLVLGCGLAGLEMMGTEQDWANLVAKFDDLMLLLTPILNIFSTPWLKHVRVVFHNLLKTYQNPDHSIINWWQGILLDSKDWAWGPSGMGKSEVQAYNGWLIEFLTTEKSVLARNLKGGRGSSSKFSGITWVPLEVQLTYLSPPVGDKGTLIGGIVGQRVVSDGKEDGVPMVEANHAWGLLLAPSSPLRKKNVRS